MMGLPVTIGYPLVTQIHLQPWLRIVVAGSPFATSLSLQFTNPAGLLSWLRTQASKTTSNRTAFSFSASTSKVDVFMLNLKQVKESNENSNAFVPRRT